jgi:AraC-like DNA-binding protein
LTWIERGHGLRWVGDSVEPFIAGDLVLIGGETAHLWSSREPQPAAGSAATVLQFPPDWAARTGLPELGGVARLIAHAAPGLAVQSETRAAVQRLLARLPDASATRRIAVFIEVLGVLLEGGADLRALSGRRPALSSSAAGTGTGNQRIDRVLNWIESNLEQELRADEAAAMAHVSAAAFARFFRREVGKSFTEYVNDARCGWAALRLTQGREPVAEIAQACGFPTLSNFGEQFRRRYAMSPRAFRAEGIASMLHPGRGPEIRAGDVGP